MALPCQVPLFFEIELITANGLEFPVEAILDTSFSDWVVINTQDLDALDWLFVGEDTMQFESVEDWGKNQTPLITASEVAQNTHLMKFVNKNQITL